MRACPPPSPVLCHTRSRDGFTLVEVLIAMVLMAVVFALGSSFLTRSVASSSEANGDSRARAKALEASERFATDVRSARATGRDGTVVVGTNALIRAVRDDGNLYDTSGTVLDWRDVAVALPTRLVLQSDVVDTPGFERPECITWEVIAPSSASWYLQRTVRSWTTRCVTNGAQLERTRLSDIVTGAPPTRMFSYDIARSAGTYCTTVGSIAPSSSDRNRIVAVSMDYGGIVANGNKASITGTANKITLRARLGADYQDAMGCLG